MGLVLVLLLLALARANFLNPAEAEVVAALSGATVDFIESAVDALVEEIPGAGFVADIFLKFMEGAFGDHESVWDRIEARGERFHGFLVFFRFS